MAAFSFSRRASSGVSLSWKYMVLWFVIHLSFMGFRIFFRRAEQRLGRHGAWHPASDPCHCKTVFCNDKGTTCLTTPARQDGYAPGTLLRQIYTGSALRAEMRNTNMTVHTARTVMTCRQRGVAVSPCWECRKPWFRGCLYLGTGKDKFV